MKKADRMDALVRDLVDGSADSHDPCYLGYFQLFDERRYYEAHDVLEHLWLHGDDPENAAFYKGLIQIAGGFVHLQKHYLRPHHYKFSNRLRPASRLLALGIANITPYGPRHLGLDVDHLVQLCSNILTDLTASQFTRNPWRPESAPTLGLPD